MEIFISWSGERSKSIALILKDWIPLVFQTASPFVSSEDIRKGDRWSGVIAEQLERTDFGIIVLTPENVNAPWIHFEAGALSKYVDRARVVPLLHDMKAGNMPDGPLRQFQAATTTRDDIFGLCEALEQALPSPAQNPPNRLERVFGALWNDLQERIGTIQKPPGPESPETRDGPASTEEILDRIYKEVRSTSFSVNEISKSIGLSSSNLSNRNDLPEADTTTLRLADILNKSFPPKRRRAPSEHPMLRETDSNTSSATQRARIEFRKLVNNLLAKEADDRIDLPKLRMAINSTESELSGLWDDGFFPSHEQMTRSIQVAIDSARKPFDFDEVPF